MDMTTQWMTGAITWNQYVAATAAHNAVVSAKQIAEITAMNDARKVAQYAVDGLISSGVTVDIFHGNVFGIFNDGRYVEKGMIGKHYVTVINGNVIAD